MAQPGLPLGTAAHIIPHMLQFITSETTLTSHPLAKDLSQSAKPFLQVATAQLPSLQPAVPLGVRPQAILHAPQFNESPFRSASQPSPAFWSQSAKPGSQAVIVQPIALHPGVACGVLQTRPQPPQFW